MKKENLVKNISARMISLLVIVVFSASYAFFSFGVNNANITSNITIGDGDIDFTLNATPLENISLIIDPKELMEKDYVVSFNTNVDAAYLENNTNENVTCKYQMYYTPTNTFNNSSTNAVNYLETAIKWLIVSSQTGVTSEYYTFDLDGISSKTLMDEYFALAEPSNAYLFTFSFELYHYSLRVNQDEQKGNTISGKITFESKGCSNVLPGDINLDDTWTDADLTLLENHINGTSTLTGQALTNADLNMDGTINYVDYMLLYETIEANSYYYPQNGGIYVMYGDVDEDGYVTSDDAEMLLDYLLGNSKLNAQGYVNADINLDYNVDFIDYGLILGVSDGTFTQDYIFEPVSEGSIVYGDVNEDGTIDIVDASNLRSFIGGTGTISAQGAINADVNEDGRLTEEDCEIIRKYAVKLISSLPYTD